MHTQPANHHEEEFPYGNRVMNEILKQNKLISAQRNQKLNGNGMDLARRCHPDNRRSCH